MPAYLACVSLFSCRPVCAYVDPSPIPGVNEDCLGQIQRVLKRVGTIVVGQGEAVVAVAASSTKTCSNNHKTQKGPVHRGKAARQVHVIICLLAG